MNLIGWVTVDWANRTGFYATEYSDNFKYQNKTELGECVYTNSKRSLTEKHQFDDEFWSLQNQMELDSH